MNFNTDMCVVVLPAARYNIIGHRILSGCSTVGLVQRSDKAKITGSSPVIPTIFMCYWRNGSVAAFQAAGVSSNLI